VASKVLLVDAQNCLYRAAYRIGAELGRKQEPVYGPSTRAAFLSMVRAAASRVLPRMVWVVWDGGRSKRRLSLHPTYKASKHPLAEQVRRDQWSDVAEISRLLLRLGCRVLVLPGREADDVLAFLARKFEAPVVLSDDQDYLQLVEGGVAVYRQSAEEYVSRLNFRERFGVEPESYLLYRALVGDRSDNLEGVPGIGEKIASSLVNDPTITTPEQLAKRVQTDGVKWAVKPRIRALVLENLDRIRINIEMLDTAREILNVDEISKIHMAMTSDIVFDESVASDLGRLGVSWMVDNFTIWSQCFRRLV